MSFDTGSIPAAAAGGQGQLSAEMQQFVQEQMVVGQLREQITKLTNTCWDMCDVRIKDKLDGKAETCLSNCAVRFIDASLFVENRFKKKFSGGQ